jgi:hypothetical protein
MRTPLLLLALFGTPALADDLAVGQAATWDLNALDHNQCRGDRGEFLDLGPGAYQIDAYEGPLLAWSPWSTNTGCDPTGANCTQGYRVRALVFDHLTSQAVGRLNSDERLWATPEQAYAQRSTPEVFCVPDGGTYRLSIADGFCDDNRLGQSVRMRRLDNTCAQAACLGNTLAGDADGDGICQDLDLCWGDDVFGDRDADGVCDGQDFDGLRLEVAGSCPGLVTLSLSQALPNTAVRWLASDSPGQVQVPTGFCAGLRTNLGSGVRVVADNTSNARGEVLVRVNLTAATCGSVVQVIEPSTCTLSNPVFVPE